MIVGIVAVDRLCYVKSPDLVDGGEAPAGLTAGLSRRSRCGQAHHRGTPLTEAHEEGAARCDVVACGFRALTLQGVWGNI